MYVINKLIKIFQLVSYFFIAYFAGKVFKTDWMDTKKRRAKMKILLSERNSLKKKYDYIVTNKIRGEKTSIKKEMNALKKEIKGMTPDDKIKEFTDILSKL